MIVKKKDYLKICSWLFICRVFRSLLNYRWRKDEVHTFWEYSQKCRGCPSERFHEKVASRHKLRPCLLVLNMASRHRILPRNVIQTWTCAEQQRVKMTRDIVEHVWNVMTHAQKPDLVFQRNGRVHLNWPGASVLSNTGSRGVRISGSNGSNAGYIMFWGRVQDCWLPTPLAYFPFTSSTVHHRVPSGFNWALTACLNGNSCVWVLVSFANSKEIMPEHMMLTYCVGTGRGSVFWIQ